jgi:hypothetical protein
VALARPTKTTKPYQKERYATNLKKLFGAPQMGQAQSSGISSHKVPGASPLSGSPSSSS